MSHFSDKIWDKQKEGNNSENINNQTLSTVVSNRSKKEKEHYPTPRINQTNTIYIYIKDNFHMEK